MEFNIIWVKSGICGSTGNPVRSQLADLFCLKHLRDIVIDIVNSSNVKITV